MSKFINVQHKRNIDSLVDGFKEKLKNPYYLYTDKKPTPTTYYNQNVHKSTLDEGSKLQYAAVGKDSPARYNQINDLFIYGLERIVVDMNNEEWGLESSGIEGEAIILPNTIIPIANDYFTIDMIKNKKLLFKVLSVTVDTIENGSNFYKIQYKLDLLTDEDIKKQVVEEYTMVVNNVGTRFNTIIRKNDYDFINVAETITVRLKDYYINLFYDNTLQTFIFSKDYTNFYDPYMIEFLKRNEILTGSEEFIHIAHQTYVQKTFGIDYDRTFFRYIELHDKRSIRRHSIHVQGKLIENEPLSIFDTVLDRYYKLSYDTSILHPGVRVMDVFDTDLIDRIESNTKYEDFDSLYKNIIIKFFNNEEINGDDFKELEYVLFIPTMENFYNMPLLIYIIESIITRLLK